MVVVVVAELTVVVSGLAPARGYASAAIAEAVVALRVAALGEVGMCIGIEGFCGADGLGPPLAVLVVVEAVEVEPMA